MSRIQVPGGMDMENIMRQQAQAQAAINNAMIQTGVQIYAHLIGEEVSSGNELGIEDYRRLSFKAKEATPFILEAFGMIKIETKEKAEDQPDVG